ELAHRRRPSVGNGIQTWSAVVGIRIRRAWPSDHRRRLGVEMTALAERRPPVADQVPAARRRRSASNEIGQNPWSALVPLVPAAIAAAIFLRGMTAREMWNDEYATWHAAKLPIAEFDRLL